MRIAVDASRTTRAQRTGTENYALNLLRALLASDLVNQYTFYFRDTPDTQLFPIHQNMNARIIPFKRMWTHVRLAAALWRTHPDLTFVPAHTLPFAFPGRSVVTVHDLGYIYFPQAHTATGRRYLDWTTRYSARRAAAILADSEATKRDLVANYHTDPRKIHVVYPGVEGLTRAPANEIARVRAKYHLPERYLLFLGTLQPRKNITRLVLAYRAWREAHPADANIALVLAGRRGWLTLQIEAEGVIETGFIADADVAALYSGALALVFPSLYEGFGFPVIEAMRCGTPVLTSNTSSLPELSGDAALLVDPLDVAQIAEGIACLVTDIGMRERFIANGYAQAARFTWSAAAARTLQIFNQL